MEWVILHGVDNIAEVKLESCIANMPALSVNHKCVLTCLF